MTQRNWNLHNHCRQLGILVHDLGAIADTQQISLHFMLPHGQASSLPVGNRQAWCCGEMPGVRASLKGNVKPACQAVNVACRTCKTAHLLKLLHTHEALPGIERHGIGGEKMGH